MPDTDIPTEKDLLLAQLRGQRHHVLGILEGLPEEALHRAVLPSGWSCLGLVRHLALDDERFWFRGVVAGEQAVIDDLDTPESAWAVGPDEKAEDVFALYRRETELADALIEATPLDAVPAFWPDFFPDWRMHSLRHVILHVTTETATHAGHLDVVRELIDGRRWIVLD